MPLNLIFQYSSGGVSFSLYGYSGGAADPVGFCFLWVGLPPATPPDLEASWQQAGLYAFFPPASSYNWAVFGPAVYALYRQYALYSLRFAWIDATASRLIGGVYVSNGIVSAAGNMVVGQYQLLLQGATPAIALNAAKDGFSIANNGLFLLPDSYDAASVPIPLSSGLEITAAPQQQGTLNFSLGLTLAQLNACRAGLHYYHGEPVPAAPSQPAYVYYFAFDYPVFQPAAQMLLQASIDLLAPLDPLRSYLAPSASGFLSSFLSTKTGHFLSLTPAATSISGGNRFTFVNYPRAAQQTGLYCLSLQGTYTLVREDAVGKSAAENGDQLLCGLAGTEHIGFVPLSSDYAGDLIDFVPGQPALAPVFPVLTQGKGNTQDAPLLAPDVYCRTSWVQVRKNVQPPAGNGINYYYCQPRDAALFKPASADTFLELFDAEAGNTYDSNQPASAICFPMVMYAGAGEGGGDLPYPGTLADLEYQILNPSRKAAIVTKAAIAAREATYWAHKVNKLDAPVDEHFTTTPQGLLVQVDSSSTVQKWTSLVLATNADATVPADALLRLENVNATIQSAFQTNQQFLVVSKKDSLGVFPGGIINPLVTVFHNTISIAGWPFHIDIGANEYGDYSNIMLFKFCSGAVIDRVQNIQGWTQPEDFAGNANAKSSAVADDLPTTAPRLDVTQRLVGENPAFLEHIHTMALHDPKTGTWDRFF